MTTSGYMLLNATSGRLNADPNISIYYLMAGPLTGPLTLVAPPAPPDGQIITIVNHWSHACGFPVNFEGSDGQTVRDYYVMQLGPEASAHWQWVQQISTWMRIKM
jgi:hypothetical protein